MRAHVHNPAFAEDGGRHHEEMMTLYYTGQSVLLADDVCKALLRYAQALADTQGSDVVTVPVLAPDGQSIQAEFLLGPASQLYATAAGEGHADQSHPGVVEELDRRTQLLHPTAVITPVDERPPLEFDQSL